MRLCPWPRAFLSLASGVSVLGKAVLGLGFFLCPWPWPEPCVLDSTSDNYYLLMLVHITKILTLPFQVLAVLTTKDRLIKSSSLFILNTVPGNP